MKDFVITVLSIGTAAGLIYLCYTYKKTLFAVQLMLSLGVGVVTAIVAFVTEEYWVLIFSVTFGIPGIFILKIGPENTDYTDSDTHKAKVPHPKTPPQNISLSSDDEEHVRMVKHHIASYISHFIENLEKDSTLTSCKTDLIHAIKERLEKIRDLHTVKMENIEKISLALLCDIAFNLLASGEYHFYAGELDPMRPGKSMYKVYVAAMNRAVELGFNDEESKNKTIKYLDQCIREVG